MKLTENLQPSRDAQMFLIIEEAKETTLVSESIMNLFWFNITLI